MVHSGSIPINSDEAIVATIFRTGRSIVENNLQHRTHLAVFHMIKIPDMGILPLWKMMGAVIKVKDEKIGVIEISRRSPTFEECGKDFTFTERDYLTNTIEEFAPFIQKVFPRS
jgi:DNA-directed RNA polymerase subunit H (RpoH/RPB5)